MWPKERILKLLDYFEPQAENGEPVEFLDHPACWGMIALQQKLVHNKVLLFMPPFGKSLEVLPFKQTDNPKDNPMMGFDMEEKGDDVLITMTLLGDGNPDPFQMPLADVEIQKRRRLATQRINLY